MTIQEAHETLQAVQSPQSSSLRQHVFEALQNYFRNLKSGQPLGVHNLVLEEVESALYEAVMKHTRGNQSRAAKLMGVSRGTLRTKLKYYFNTTHVGIDA
jgi:Fis family transcriptional regulator, factor for inversion stimulation protein